MATKDKYDRQLRLWGASGQRALSQSTIVLFNASAVGTETLKNLVLPGVGSFHIVDEEGAVVPQQNTLVFSNFFVFGDNHDDEEGTTKVRTRAEVACRHLMELNPDVNGTSESVPSFEQTDYAALLSSIAHKTKTKNNKQQKEEEYYYGKVTVIAADLPPKPLLSLSTACWNANVSLVIVKSYGLIGSVRIQLNHHPIIQSRPDTEVPDLRLAEQQNIFPALHQLADEVNLEKLDDKEHSHVPCVLLLIKAMKVWRDKHHHQQNNETKNALPKTLQEKNDYREIIKSMSRNINDEENFEEAYKDYAYLAYTKKELPYEVQSMMEDVFLSSTKKNIVDLFGGNDDDDDDDDNTDVNDVKFQMLLLTLSKFLKEHNGQPPLNGSIPDMTSSTDLFIKLQEVYKTKAKEDVKRMQQILDDIVEEYKSAVASSSSSSSSLSTTTLPTITEEELVSFCKNVFNLQLLKTRPYHEEYQSQTRSSSSNDDTNNKATVTKEEEEEEEEEEIKQDLLMATMDPYEQAEHTPLLWHIALRACDKFHEEHGVYPGRDGRALSLASDVKQVQSFIKEIVVNLGLEDADLMKETLLLQSSGEEGGEGEENKHAAEMVRYYNAEVHNVGSVLGGVASQEVVKIITGQYVPLNDTFIYNGIVGVGGVYRF